MKFDYFGQDEFSQFKSFAKLSHNLNVYPSEEILSAPYLYEVYN